MAWKLAYVVNRNASPSLLESYTAERQPAAEQTMKQAFSRLANRVLRDPGVVRDKELPDDTCELGYRYPRGAFVFGDNLAASAIWEDPNIPKVQIGARLPHVALSDKSKQGTSLSTLDLVKKNFLLLVGEGLPTWQEASSAQSIQIDVHEISETSSPLCDPSGRFREVYRLGTGEALLIRPDGVIAWRGKGTKGHSEFTTLKEILGQILGA